VLGFTPGTFHVHVVAPLADRIANLHAYEGLDAEQARKRILESDAARRRYVMLAGRRDWEDPLLYDLIVNTHRLRPERAAGLIVDASRQAGVLERNHLR
jgi:cytidylate kinase